MLNDPERQVILVSLFPSKSRNVSAGGPLQKGFSKLFYTCMNALVSAQCENHLPNDMPGIYLYDLIITCKTLLKELSIHEYTAEHAWLFGENLEEDEGTSNWNKRSMWCFSNVLSGKAWNRSTVAFVFRQDDLLPWTLIIHSGALWFRFSETTPELQKVAKMEPTPKLSPDWTAIWQVFQRPISSPKDLHSHQRVVFVWVYYDELLQVLIRRRKIMKGALES